MQYGVCVENLAMARIAKKAGYDYFEWGVSDLLHPGEHEDVFLSSLAQAKAVNLPFPVVNRFLPAELKITGPDIHHEILQSYISTALRRAEIAGLEYIVLGAGGARRIPPGFDLQQGWDQMVQFCQWMAQVAALHGVVIAIEPLNNSETNLINTAEEAAALVREVDHPNIRMLIDGYHWAKDQNSISGILENTEFIVHAHVAAVEGRRSPSIDDPCDSFFEALRRSGYDGRLSFEGNLLFPQEEIAAALSIMRSQHAVKKS